MVIRRVLGLLLSSAFLASASHALEPTEWKNRQTLKVEASGLVSVTLPDETIDAARLDRGDLRLLNPSGQEVAFLLRQGTRPAVHPIRAKSFRSSLTPTTTQLTLETSDSPVTAVILETPTADFVKSARLETSPDGITWQVSETGAPLFRQRGAEQLRLLTTARFVRITLDDTRSRPVPFTGALIIPAGSLELPTRPVSTRIARREEFAGETVLTLELAAAHVPLESLQISSSDRLFTRRVNLGVRELRDESAVERTAASGTIFNLAVDNRERTTHGSVALDFSAPSRELTVHILNEDSPPLAISGVLVSRYEVTLTFDATTPGDYTLLSGHAQTSSPRYDLSGIRVGKTASMFALVPGALTPNPGYRVPEALAGATPLGATLDPSPWSYRKAVRLTAGGVQQLELDLDVLVHAQPGFADLRLVRDGTQIPYLVERPALSRSLDLTASPMPDPKRPQLSRWEIKLPRPGLPLTKLTLTSATALFQRQLRLFEKITDDRGNSYERPLASAAWSHTPGETRSLTVALGATPTTDTLLLETDNGDNPAIALGSIAAAYPVTRLLFKTESPPTFYYGNREVPAPRYDLALVATQLLAAEKTLATLGPEEKARPEGWSPTRGQYAGVLFWSVLALVVIALLTIVAKLLPKAPTG
jgi:hypothetical protein